VHDVPSKVEREVITWERVKGLAKNVVYDGDHSHGQSQKDVDASKGEDAKIFSSIDGSVAL
jgi:hypothetical protein